MMSDLHSWFVVCELRLIHSKSWFVGCLRLHSKNSTMRRLTYKLGKFSPPTEVYKSYKPSNANKRDHSWSVLLL
jgi:hypothetical protein